jgi:serine/threonine protein kinase
VDRWCTSSVSNLIARNIIDKLFYELCIYELFCIFSQFGILHGDIRPENMFVHQSRFILADFGNSVRLAPGSTVSGITGTRAYSSPQMLAGLDYTLKTDLFSWGASIHMMLTGTLPYPHSVLDLTQHERSNDIVQMNIHVSKICVELLKMTHGWVNTLDGQNSVTGRDYSGFQDHET